MSLNYDQSANTFHSLSHTNVRERAQEQLKKSVYKFNRGALKVEPTEKRNHKHNFIFSVKHFLFHGNTT